MALRAANFDFYFRNLITVFLPLLRDPLVKFIHILPQPGEQAHEKHGQARADGEDTYEFRRHVRHASSMMHEWELSTDFCPVL